MYVYGVQQMIQGNELVDQCNCQQSHEQKQAIKKEWHVYVCAWKMTRKKYQPIGNIITSLTNKQSGIV